MSLEIIGTDKTLHSIEPPKEINCQVGEVYNVSGIEVLCTREGEALQQGNNLYSLESASTHPMFIDRKHDLNFYFTESDFISSYAVSWGIDKDVVDVKPFLYEGYPKNITYYNNTSEEVDAGPSNTDYLLTLDENVTGDYAGCKVPTFHIKEFRKKFGDNWFLGSWDSFRILTQGQRLKDKLLNVDTSSYTENYRRSWGDFLSSSFNSTGAQMICDVGRSDMLDNNHLYCRVRMSVIL